MLEGIHMFERVHLKKINDHIYLMDDNHETSGYIVIGSKKAVIIDTMNGYENVYEIARTVTDLPLMVINTHGHPDHIYGNIYFEEVYIHPEDMELAHLFFQDPEFVSQTASYGLKPAKMLPINPGDMVDLGDLELEIIGLPGHSKGSICLLSKKDRILFVGDVMVGHTWMQLDWCLPLEEMLHNLNEFSKRWEEFDYVSSGHWTELVPVSFCKLQRDAVASVLAGDTKDDEDYTWFGGICKAHPYSDETGENHYKIVYDPKNLRRII